MLQLNTPSAKMFGTFHYYDTTNLYTIKPQINIALNAIEQSFTQFVDMPADANILSDALIRLREIAGALQFLKLHGANELANALADLLETFSTTLAETSTARLEAFAEGLMLVSRYCEFVQLREAVVPHLLLPIINTIRLELKQPLIREGDFFASQLQASILTLPNQPPNIMPADERQATKDNLRPLFQYGLLGVLSKHPEDNHFKAIERAVFYAYMLTGDTDCELFWHTAYCAVQQLQDSYPISDSRKRVLIAIEQQLKNIDDLAEKAVFVDVLAMGLCRDNQSAQDLREQLNMTTQITTDLYAADLRGFIFGPTSSTIFTAGALAFEKINKIKDLFIENPAEINTDIDYSAIGQDMRQLGNALTVLGLTHVTQDVFAQATLVAELHDEPNETQVNQIMMALLRAENAVAKLEKSYTPGGVLMPLYNMDISLFQLDQAQVTLIKACKDALKTVMQALDAYQAHEGGENHDMIDAPSTLDSASGAMAFLHTLRAEKILKNTAKIVSHRFAVNAPEPKDSVFERLATIISSMEYYLDGLLAQTPTGEQPFILAEACLSELQVA